MTKQDVVKEVAKKTQITQKKAEGVVNAFLEVIDESLKGGEVVSFIGFGSFSVSNRSAREGINPTTKKRITIPAKKVVKFKVGKKLKNSIQEQLQTINNCHKVGVGFR